MKATVVLQYSQHKAQHKSQMPAWPCPYPSPSHASGFIIHTYSALYTFALLLAGLNLFTHKGTWLTLNEIHQTSHISF